MVSTGGPREGHLHSWTLHIFYLNEIFLIIMTVYRIATVIYADYTSKDNLKNVKHMKH